MVKAKNFKKGEYIDYAPSGSAVVAGDPVQVAGIAGICATDIADGVQGAAQVGDIVKIVAAAAVGNVGDPVGWDADGDPYGGTAGTGAATTVLSAIDFLLGSLVVAKGATDTHLYARLNKYPVDRPVFANRIHETKSDDYTVDAEDSGKVIHIDTDAKTITLPATTVGLKATFVNDGADGAVAINLSPNAADKIMGPDIAGADDKDLINTKGTAKRGDFVTLVGDGASGWFVTEIRGTLATDA